VEAIAAGRNRRMQRSSFPPAMRQRSGPFTIMIISAHPLQFNWSFDTMVAEPRLTRHHARLRISDGVPAARKN
jgi:hypothetical protein